MNAVGPKSGVRRAVARAAPESNFSTLQRNQVRTLLAEFTASVPLNERMIALDRVLANIDKSQIIPKNIEGVKADPPPIFFSKAPAVLVNVDGDPIWSPIKGNDLQYAVNTNWDLCQYTPTKTLYLRATYTWLKAAALQGPWTYAGPLPDSFYKLPNDPNWKDAKGALPGKKIAPTDAPRVFATTTPAELILLKGEPAYAPVAGTESGPATPRRVLRERNARIPTAAAPAAAAIVRAVVAAAGEGGYPGLTCALVTRLLHKRPYSVRP